MTALTKALETFKRIKERRSSSPVEYERNEKRATTGIDTTSVAVLPEATGNEINERYEIRRHGGATLGTQEAPGYEINEKYEISPPVREPAGLPDLFSCNSFLSYPGIVVDAAGLQDVCCSVQDDGGPVGLDVETTGLDPLHDRIRMLQVRTFRSTFIIDVFAFENAATALVDLFEDLAAVEVIGHNLVFDLRFLDRLGFVPGKAFDTLLASQVLHAGEREEAARLGHKLQDVAERELGEFLDKDEQKSDWSRPVLTESQIAYARRDVEVLLPLAETLRAKLAEAKLTETADIEMLALLSIAWAGPVQVDTVAWLTLAKDAEEEEARLREAMDAAAPADNLLGARNWNSPEQVKAAFESLGMKLTSTDDDSLATVDHPLADLVRRFRTTLKRTGTYGRSWIEDHAPKRCVMPGWVQMGAESGRMSCKSPNLQQIPRGTDYRRCFKSREGYVLVKADYSQIELRIAAKIANEKRMIEAYRKRDDLHAFTAAKILGKLTSEVQKADRQLAKAINFGLLYGMGAKGLAAYAKSNYGVDLTELQARHYRDTFFRTYPGIDNWHARIRRDVKKLFADNPSGMHAIYTLGGRRRFLPVAGGNAEKQFPNITDALNTPVQGSGADGLKIAIGMLWEQRQSFPLARPVLFCHDEIVLEVPQDQVDAAADWLKRVMVEAMTPLIDPVPVEVEVTIGKTWGG